MTRTSITSLTLLLGVLLFAGCSQQEAAEAEAPEQVAEATETTNRRQVRIETVFVNPSSFEDVIEITGTIEAYNDATVSAQVAGTINFRVPRGAYVGSNRVIALVDSTLLHASYMQGVAQLEVAKAQYDLAHDTFKRQEPLFEDSIISALEFENVRAQYNQAAGQLSQAKALVAQFKEQLDNTRISSPFSGTVETYFAELGEQVTPGSPIVRVVNTRRVKVVAGVPERYANEIEKGTPVRIAFDNYGNAERTGTVSFVGNAINSMSRTFPIEIILDNSDQNLKPEMVASLFLTRDEIKDVLVIPQAAVPLNEEGHTVFVVVDDNEGQAIAERRIVTLGPSYEGNVVVESGLEAGDQVVINGQYNLTNGDAVEVVNSSSDTVASL
ncbi:MAG: efflux RND transporter periplasmic adaptor subunit [Rhodothermaceae bacterium]|nr:efflux RND transporter periplasmic adaptor subunit [Rhodothermaceae bacterium]